MRNIARTLFSGLLLLAGSACDMPGNLNSAKATDITSCTPGTQHPQSDAGLDQVTLCIKSGSKTHMFTVEIARTSRQQAQGLMFRTELADNAGMVFPFPEMRMASFWMKNTVIPLDIIFIRADGIIENIAENTIPYSTTPVGSTAPVTAVLELRGGLTGELGIKAGDIIDWTPHPN